MTHFQRIRSILTGLLLIFAGFGIPFAEKGYLIAVLFLGLAMLLKGIRLLFYFFTMARYMVGGKSILYRGVIYYEIGSFALTLVDVPRVYLMLYLIGIHFFSGAVDVLKALEERRAGSAGWIRKLWPGAINILAAVICMVFIRYYNVAIAVYGAGLIYSGILKIGSAFRRTAMVYIQ